MPDSYHLPALVLTVLLLPAFFQLYLRFRDTRTLLWFLGFFFACIRMLQFYNLGWWNYSDTQVHPWIAAVGQTSILISSALFLASLAPLGFRIGRVRILYAVPFAIPLVAYAFLIYGVYGGNTPAACRSSSSRPLARSPSLLDARGPSPFVAFPAAYPSPSASFSAAPVSGSAFVSEAHGPSSSLSAPSTLSPPSSSFTSSGASLPEPSSPASASWAGRSTSARPSRSSITANPTWAIRIIAMSKVVAAIGMILLALEDQLAINQIGQIRERHAREEMEAYARLNLARRRVEDFDRQAAVICQSIVSNSRFKQAALVLLQNTGHYHLAGAAGFDDATFNALEALAARIPVANFLDSDSSPAAAEHSLAFNLDLTPFLVPGDDLTASNSPPSRPFLCAAVPQPRERCFLPDSKIPALPSGPSIFSPSKSLPLACNQSAARP